MCALGVIVGVPITLRQMSGEPVSAGAPVAPSPATADEAPTVRVEHEFVTVSPAVPNESGAPTRPPAVRVMRPVRAAVSESRTLAGKTKRAFLGDGRHRPAPFPSVR